MHLQTPLQLCGIAVAHGLEDPARKLCRQTWELATGFSHRKDPTLSKTLDAIGFLVDHAPEAARQLLAQVASQVHSVLDYTDGSGTRHVLAEADVLLAKLAPAALVTKYEEHLSAGQWTAAENSLSAYIEQGVKSGWQLDALMRTGLHPNVGNVLQRLPRRVFRVPLSDCRNSSLTEDGISVCWIARNILVLTPIENLLMVTSQPSNPNNWRLCWIVSRVVATTTKRCYRTGIGIGRVTVKGSGL